MTCTRTDWFYPMKLPWAIARKHYYIAVFCLISLAFVTFSYVLYKQYNKVQTHNDFSLYQSQVIDQSRLIVIDLVDMETSVRGFMVTGDEAFLDPYFTAYARLQSGIVNLRNTTYPEVAAREEVNSWLKVIDNYQKLLSDQITDVRTRGAGSPSSAALNAQKAQMDELRQMLDQSIARRGVTLRLQSKAAQSQKNNFLTVIVLGNVLMIGILLVGTVTIINLEVANQRFEDAHRRSEERFKTVLNGINDGVFEYNFINDSMYMSPEYKSMLGYDEADIKDDFKATIDLIHPDDKDAALATLKAFREGPSALYTNVFRMHHKDGTWRWIMSRAVAQRGDDGRMRSMVGAHTDITDQKNREEELRQLHADMETFTYITSHDLRSPLVNLKGFSRELDMAIAEVSDTLTPYQDKIKPEDWSKIDLNLHRDIPEALTFIGKGVERMDTLTTAILDLSRIGRYVHRYERVDSRAIIDKCIGAQSFEIQNKGAEVIIHDLPELVTDALALEQVFSNLLDNAVKYLTVERKGRIEIGSQQTARDFVFYIRDNGRGIDAADSGKIFEIFRRARNTSDVRGLGIGMSFVKTTLRKMDGAIWFESAVGVGTTFFVRLPRRGGVNDMADESQAVLAAGTQVLPARKAQQA
ncbi:ATP-binding protein [Asticcacaulis machinosus]|uniref:histidine kinase n=1 Tax=Asticcacaulis machinosus TaxID=2984211 RepID=A0ABT5HKD9_9CAUL|nr:ATP-binding protein [Asticcacaulis machinosus]MDC7676698.1 ATP-binding protein [Asticcacaulis machinosus]